MAKYNPPHYNPPSLNIEGIEINPIEVVEPLKPEQKIAYMQPLPFQCCEIGTIPTSYKEALSYEQQILWLCNYLETVVIPSINQNANAVTELKNLFNQLMAYYIVLQEYVNSTNKQFTDYLNNSLTSIVNFINNTNNSMADFINTTIDDMKAYIDQQFSDMNITDEINAKIDQMAQDGTLENIINKQLLNKKINNITPDFIKNNNYLMTITYNTPNTKQKFLSISQDGINWNKICELPENAFISNRAFDISLMIKDNVFYMIYDVIDENFNDYNTLNKEYFLGGNRIAISKTTDFITFEKYYLDIDLSFKETFAPEFFEDNGKVYVILNMTDALETYTETRTGKIGYLQKCYLLELNDDFTEIVNTTQILDTDVCVIDPCIHKENGIYYLFIKDETNDFIMQYKSNSLTSFTNKINDIKFFHNANTISGIEAPSLIKFKNLFFLYCDTFDLSHRTIAFISDNIENWYNHNFIENSDIMYHFSPLYIDDENKRNILNNCFQAYNFPSQFKNNKISNFIEYINYENKNFEKFYVLPNKHYVAYFGNYTLNIDLSLLNNNDNFSITNKQGINNIITIKSPIIQSYTNDFNLHFSETINLLKYTSTQCLINYYNKINLDKKYLLIGDSYGEGYTPTGNIESWTTKFKNIMNLTDSNCITNSRGGYGFATPNHLFYNLINEIPNDNQITDVIILGGYNDIPYNKNEILSGISNCLNLVNQKFPNAKMYVGAVGLCNNANKLLNVNEMVRNYLHACKNLDIKYIDNIQYTLHNYYDCLSNDGFHPNELGQTQIAENLAFFMKNKSLNVYFDYVNTRIAFTDNFSSENFGNLLGQFFSNNNVNMQIKGTVQLTANNVSMTGNGTKYKIGSLENGFIVGNRYAMVNMPITFILHDTKYYTVNGALTINNKELFISFFEINEEGSNFKNHPSVNSIQILPSSITVNSDIN